MQDFSDSVKCLSTLEVIILHSPCKMESSVFPQLHSRVFVTVVWIFANLISEKWHFSVLFIFIGIDDLFTFQEDLHFPPLMSWTFSFLNIYLFNSGCAGSSSLHGPFL